jgi:hypothetical protein
LSGTATGCSVEHVPTTEEVRMYARLAKFEGGDPTKARAEAERRMDAGEGPPGMQGYLVLRDEEAGKTIFISFFEDRQAAEEGDRFLDKMGDEIPEDVRGKRIGAALYEVAMMKAPAMV